jgi:hypothetical protein
MIEYLKRLHNETGISIPQIALFSCALLTILRLPILTEPTAGKEETIENKPLTEEREKDPLATKETRPEYDTPLETGGRYAPKITVTGDNISPFPKKK